MKDPIERADAINALADYIHNVDKVIGTGHLSADDCKDAATSVLEDIPSAQPEVDCQKCIFRGFPGFKQFQPKSEERMQETVQNVSDSDLIFRKAAIEAIDAVFPVDPMKSVHAQGIAFGVALARTYVEQLPSAQPAQRWIPCSERTPEKAYGQYWVCTDTGYQCQCQWTDNVYGLGSSGEWTWKIFDIPQYSHVVAWMPLPEPYKERREE